MAHIEYTIDVNNSSLYTFTKISAWPLPGAWYTGDVRWDIPLEIQKLIKTCEQKAVPLSRTIVWGTPNLDIKSQ